LDFFPINEAICLLHVKENDAEDMIQVVITKLDDMKKKQDILVGTQFTISCTKVTAPSVNFS
jgi:hypothetical protein